MGHWEWEGGTITLPSTEFTTVFHAVIEAQKRRQALFLAHAEKFWATIPPKAKRNRDLYREWTHAYVFGNVDEWDCHRRWPKNYAKPSIPEQKGVVRSEEQGWPLQTLLENVIYEWVEVEQTNSLNGRTWKQTQRQERNPRKVTKAMAEKAFPTTNRTTTFHFGEASITFDRKHRTVNYSSGENRHVIDAARNHPLGKALFDALDRVTWTRGSGGKILGNSELNRDSDYEGGGGNYVVDEYGPKHPRRRAYASHSLGYGRTYAGRW